MSQEIKHPVFARVYSRLTGAMEKEIGKYRHELVSGLTGSVLEIGAGNGMNFSHYGADAEITAIEPEPYLRKLAIRAALASTASIVVTDATAGSLPFEDGSFDTVVACLVLCTVADQTGTLAEIRRVLKPGGELRFFEHVASDRGVKVHVQKVLDRSRLWPTLAGGCNCSRDTVQAIKDSGFAITSVRPLNVGFDWAHTNPHVIGRAMIKTHTP